MTFRKIVLGVLLAQMVLLVAACNNTPAAPTPVPTAVQPTPSTPDSAEILVETSGSIAGIRRVLQITSQGQATLTDRDKPIGTLQLTPDRLQALLDKFTAADFFALKDRYDSGTVSDDIYSTVTFNQGTRSKTVIVAQIGGKSLTPQPLQEVLSELDKVEKEIEEAPAPSTTTTP